MKRIFIALKVDAGQSMLKMISDLRSGLTGQKIKWTDPDNIHITIVFLGDTDEKMIDVISSILENKCAESGQFALTVRGLDLFRNLSDPRIIWTGLDQSAELTNLNKVIVTGLSGAGIRVEERQFNPHLTLGRIKHLDNKDSLKLLLNKYYNTKIQEVPVNEIILYESILKPTGPVYKPICIYPL